MDHLNGRIQEALTGIRAIKAFVRGEWENEQFGAVNGELCDASTETFRHAVLNTPSFQAVMYAAIVCIMWFGGTFILNGTMQVGQLTGFLSYVLQVLNSVMMFSGVFLQMTRSLASARRIREVLTEQPDLADAATRSPRSPTAPSTSRTSASNTTPRPKRTPCRTSRCTSRRGPPWASSAAPAPPRPPWCS